ncbi:multidrug resistance protein 4 [Coprinopsis sp. MPI-PUGE-AT-0042]|nr:multidrug resistance protein 4 [Coprinopsis sp. MPI-PUGE-AT-0042]
MPDHMQEKDQHRTNGDISTAASSSLSPTTQDPAEDTPPKYEHSGQGHAESALPVDRDAEALDHMQQDWGCDPENARNWPAVQKWLAVSIVSLYTFASPLGSSMMAPGLQEVAFKYGITDSTTLALTLSIFLLSFAIAPLILAPLSEIYGRTWVLHIGNIFTIAFNLGCAFAPNTGTFIAFRFLSGISGSAPTACGGGSIGDLFSEKDRATAMAIYSLGPLLGPVAGPVAGGFIAQAAGIRWVFITIALICGAVGLYGVLFLRETYGPVIRYRRAERRGELEMFGKVYPHLVASHGNAMQVLWNNLARPVQILCTSFICFILSFYVAVMYGVFFLMFATFAELFATTYGFKAGVGGLAYLGLGVGFVLSAIAGAKFANQVYLKLASKNGGVGNPEMRIPALFFGSLFVPVGIFWYGWSAQAKLHWIMPIIGSGIFAFGMMTSFLPIQLYLVDSFHFAASAVAASGMFRSLLGFAFPLFGKQMFDAMSVGGGNSLLAGVAIVLGIPFPVYLYYKGAELRARNPLTRRTSSEKGV